MTTSHSCRICGARSPRSACASCAAVAELVRGILEPMFVVVDGSFYDDHGGAGLVLVVGSLRGDVAATCACRFNARSSAEAEFQAIVRGRRWAPGVDVYSDCLNAIGASGKDSRARVRWIDPAERSPNHGIAHRLSRAGRRAQTAIEASRRAEIVRS